MPNDSDPDILFVHHGSSRSTYSSGSERLAEQEGLAVFSPIFPESSYDSDDYQRGGIVDEQDRVLPEDQWTTRLEEPMVDWARSQVDGDENVYLFGFSAGAQYLSRVAAYERPQDIARIVVASPSTWVLPSLTEDGPYGFDGLGTDAEERQMLKEYLALPMTILLGSEDDDPNHPDLATGVRRDAAGCEPPRTRHQYLRNGAGGGRGERLGVQLDPRDRRGGRAQRVRYAASARDD